MNNDTGYITSKNNMNGQESSIQPIIDDHGPQPQRVVPDHAAVAEPPPKEVIDLWNTVAEGLDRNATVVWESAVNSLEAARRHLRSSSEARHFVNTRMQTIISILLEQNPNKIGPKERDCVEKSVRIALTIVRDDLEMLVTNDTNSSGNLEPCATMGTLHHILQKKKLFYRSNKNWSNQQQGAPEIRLQMILTFKRLRGFYFLGLFMEKRSMLSMDFQLIQSTNTQQGQQQLPPMPIFPPLDTLHLIIEGLKDSIPLPNDGEQQSDTEEPTDILRITHASQSHLLNLDEEKLKRLNPEMVKGTMYHLQRIYEKLSLFHPPYINDFYTFSRSLVLRLITSASLPLKLLGWTALEEIIEASIEKRPPPRSYIVSGAGLDFINGTFEFDPKRINEGGWVKNNMDLSYVRKIPESSTNPASGEDGVGKTLTLFRCTMRSQQKWWFISEADEDQPGTDKDIDYYQHKSKANEDMLPSRDGWLTCRSGVDPAPTLRGVGLMVPPGEEENTLECVLAKWAIENEVIELVLGDSIHREIVARSTALIKFLAKMCDNENTSAHNGDIPPTSVVSPMQTDKTPNPYCLKLSHLLLAWKTCTSKTDAAVSAEIYNLLVSILPSLPEDLAIPLLLAIRSEVNSGNHNFYEVSEFCVAFASIFEEHYKNNNPMNIKPRVREEILGLQWAILSHEDARTLKSYENIENYVSHEMLQTDTVASKMRNQFLLHCREMLNRQWGRQSAAMVNEAHALHMVQLTWLILRFVLDSETWSPEMPDSVLTAGTHEEDKRSFADLLLLELIAYLNRGRVAIPTPPVRKPSSSSVAVPDTNYSKGLSDRLQILRNVYGVSSTAVMTSKQIDNLWSLCILPVNREAIMNFVADASISNSNVHATSGKYYAVFPNEVCVHIFENLFCSANVGWECLGEIAFGSFHSLFKSLEHAMLHDSAIKERAIDTLWRICLSAGNENVAINAMNELLALYIQNNYTVQQDESDEEHSRDMGGKLFSKRIFECLLEVNQGLQKGNKSSLRSAERCIKILKHAFEMSSLGGGVSAVAERLRREKEDSLNAYLQKIPHGIRGVSACMTVSVMAKKSGSSSDRFSMEIHPLQSFETIKKHVAKRCEHNLKMLKLTDITGRSGNDERPLQRPNFNVFSDIATAADLGISEGSEMIFMLLDKALESGTHSQGQDFGLRNDAIDLSGLLEDEGEGNSFGVFFDTLISVLESLPTPESTASLEGSIVNIQGIDSHSLVWDVLLAMPTNTRVCDFVEKAAIEWKLKDNSSDAMIIDSAWSSLIDITHFERSVYVLQVLDFSLRPPPHLFSCLSPERAGAATYEITSNAHAFQSNFIRSGGFEAVLRLFVECGNAEKKTRRRMRMGNEFALRILSTCFFGDEQSRTEDEGVRISKEGLNMMKTFPNISDFLRSLMYIVVDDEGVTDAAILKVISLVEAMLKSDQIFTTGFANLSERVTERFLTSLLLREGSLTNTKSAAVIRKRTENMILETTLLSASALPFLLKAMTNLNSQSEGSSEFFSTMMKLVAAAKNEPRNISIDREMEELGTAICDKLAFYPRPTSDNEHSDYSTGVLCGCLNLLISLIDLMGGEYLLKGSHHLLKSLKNKPWCENPQRNLASTALINVMGTVFDCFVSSSQSPGSPPICSDKKSRELAFRVVLAAAQACNNGDGYHILVSKINDIMSLVAPSIRHTWAYTVVAGDENDQRRSNTSKYSGLKNQGCTCYMNSFLQQLFMMPILRNKLCSAEIPSSLRSCGGGAITEGSALVGKKISLHWDCGNNYDAMVDDFDEKTKMHTISYLPIQLSTQHHPHPPDLSLLPKELPEQFILNEGRPGRETGAFEIISSNPTILANVQNDKTLEEGASETEDEASSRKLLEEVQRTFVNLEEARGRCFDPRSLVEASNCLKLEFDVWQQNDASEFATKLLDRLEISLKKWSPSVFRYLAHTFGLKTTKQKICKECGLKTSREENLMNIDCQIRNKSTIHEALSTMCEDEIMEGDNKVFCDSCKVKTNTVLRTAISALPDVLILSLKRFDLDYTTFETVKLNSRCEFEEALNMKQYTLEAKEVIEATLTEDPKSETGSMMDLGEDERANDPLNKLPDEDFEYRLVGVLVHAGVAQGGHYYSFIKDRTSNKWYKFDDEDVTPFDPSLIEQECFGGKVKKETKFPNGHVHTVENEQFANALMLLYEKVKPDNLNNSQEVTKGIATKTPMDNDTSSLLPTSSLTNGYEVFLPSVRRSNSTYSWQSFLLTTEFQDFMSLILSQSTCNSHERDDTMHAGVLSYPQIERTSWRFDVVQLSLSYLFDVFFHLSVDKSVIDSWLEKTNQIFTSYPLITELFVSNLAERSHYVYKNWLRAYTVESTDDQSRRAALTIFASAIRIQLSNNTEQQLLQKWALVSEDEWKRSLQQLRNGQQNVSRMQTDLGTKEEIEDVSKIGSTATGIGIILSFVSKLLELSPRIVQTRIELFFFIEQLAKIDGTEGRCLRNAMNHAQIPIRLICIAWRDKFSNSTPHLDTLKLLFPGTCIGSNFAIGLCKHESQNILHMGMNNSTVNQFALSMYDVRLCLETFACLIGVPYCLGEDVTYETGEIVRGRPVVRLTPLATSALTAIFEESKTTSTIGMTKEDIQNHIKRCGIQVPPQKIDQIMNKHAIVDEKVGTKVLPLDGFLDYYQSHACSVDETQVMNEFLIFGFRPNLLCMPVQARGYTYQSNGDKQSVTAYESIATDVTLNSNMLTRNLHFLELGLWNAHFLWFILDSGKMMGQYIHAALAIGRDSTPMILELLRTLHSGRHPWNSDINRVCRTGLCILAAIPDNKQQERITTIMMHSNQDGGLGLLVFAQQLEQYNQEEQQERIDKCVRTITELQRQVAVSKWMEQNPGHCAWLEPEDESEGMNSQQSRGDYSGRRGDNHHQTMPHQMSDYDDEDYESEDDSPRSDALNMCNEVFVKDCGIPQINGTYRRDGFCDDVPKYTKRELWEGKEETFMLFRCKLSDNTRRWYISIVPGNIHPGTTKDIDFYFTTGGDNFPPAGDWQVIPQRGMNPGPHVIPSIVRQVDYNAEDCI